MNLIVLYQSSGVDIAIVLILELFPWEVACSPYIRIESKKTVSYGVRIGPFASARHRVQINTLSFQHNFAQCAVALIQLGTTRCRSNTQHAVTLTQLCTTCCSASAILQVSQSSRMSCPEISDCGCWNM